jgi:hypothetical protein
VDIGTNSDLRHGLTRANSYGKIPGRSPDTLARLSSGLGIEFHIAVTPAGVAI